MRKPIVTYSVYWHDNMTLVGLSNISRHGVVKAVKEVTASKQGPLTEIRIWRYACLADEQTRLDALAFAWNVESIGCAGGTVEG